MSQEDYRVRCKLVLGATCTLTWAMLSYALTDQTHCPKCERRLLVGDDVRVSGTVDAWEYVHMRCEEAVHA